MNHLERSHFVSVSLWTEEHSKRRAGVTKNKRRGTSKARRKIAKDSRRKNRRG